MVSDCHNSVVFVINSFKSQGFMQVFENFYTFFINFWEIDDCKDCFIYIYILNKMVLKCRVFKLMAFLAFSLLNAKFIHTNIFLYTNSYTNFVTRELCLRNGPAGINHSVQWENKLTLLHKNFDFSKHAVRNFNFILVYTIFMLISIIYKSFKKKS